MNHTVLLTTTTLLACLSFCHSQILYDFVSTSYSALEGDQIVVTIQRTSTDVAVRSIVVLLQDGGSDILGSSQVAVFQPSDTFSQVTFATVDDVIPEPDEVFQLLLQSTDVAEATIGNQHTANITVLANDNAAGIFSFQTTERLTLSEGDTVELNISRDAGDFYIVVVNLLVLASGGDILIGGGGSIEFYPGERSKTVALTAVNDMIPENEEMRFISLSVDHPNSLVEDTVRQIVVRKSDTPIRFSQERYMVAETDIQTEVQLLLMRGRETLSEDVVGPIDKQLTVKYEVIGRTADRNTDFFLNDGTVMFDVNELTKNISLRILADDVPELEEEFIVTLTLLDADSVLVHPANATVIISPNDDQHGIVSFDTGEANPMYVNEDLPVSSVVATVRRHGGTFGQIAVEYSVTGSSSVSTDISPTSGTITFNDGESFTTITLSAIDDTIPEITKTYTLHLNSLSGGARLGDVLQRDVIIQDSDIAHGAVQWRSGAHQILALNSSRYISWTLEREGGHFGDVAVTFICSYSLNGVVLPDILVSDRPYQVVLPDGESQVSVSVDIHNSAFLSIGGTFEALIDEVKLITEFGVPSFNSPYKGVTKSDRVIVGARNANGEIGFSDTTHTYVAEPDIGINKISIPISREGTSGTATISWLVTGTTLSPINSTDVLHQSGTVVLLSGSSVVNMEVEIVSDDLSETDESMAVILSDVQPTDRQRLRQNFTQVMLTIRANDNPGGVFQLADGASTSIVKEEGESFSISVKRTGGDLVSRTVLYDISASGNDDLFGATGVLTFAVGEREKSIQLIVKDDNIPELNETYGLSIRSHGHPTAVFGANTFVNITILENDSPYGQFHFMLDSIYHIYESKNGNISTAQIQVIRDRGTFSNVVVSWISVGTSAEDLSPATGTVQFLSGQDTAVIEISSVPDDIPESPEEFVIQLVSVTSGAEIVSPNSTIVSINRNDAAVFFEDRTTVYVEEGDTIELVVTRTDFTSPASVSYRTSNGTAQPTDYKQVTGEIQFARGQQKAVIEIETVQDTTPEALEVFYVQLFNPTGDLVVYNETEATVMIQANDDAGGVFRFGGPYAVEVGEGEKVVMR